MNDATCHRLRILALGSTLLVGCNAIIGTRDLSLSTATTETQQDGGDVDSGSKPPSEPYLTVPPAQEEEEASSTNPDPECLDAGVVETGTPCVTFGGPLPGLPLRPPGSVEATVPKLLGELRLDSYVALVTRALPAIEACNPDRHDLAVKVDLQITLDILAAGTDKVALAQPSYGVDAGDSAVAKCVAASLKNASPPGWVAGVGIYQQSGFSWK